MCIRDRAISEAYPDLKANTNFVSLQNELTQTEDKISFARQFYNDSVYSLSLIHILAVIPGYF